MNDVGATRPQCYLSSDKGKHAPLTPAKHTGNQFTYNRNMENRVYFDAGYTAFAGSQSPIQVAITR